MYNSTNLRWSHGRTKSFTIDLLSLVLFQLSSHTRRKCLNDDDSYLIDHERFIETFLPYRNYTNTTSRKVFFGSYASIQKIMTPFCKYFAEVIFFPSYWRRHRVYGEWPMHFINTRGIAVVQRLEFISNLKEPNIACRFELP